MGVDDSLILESPYGGTLDIASFSNDTSLNANGSLTLLVTDTDNRMSHYLLLYPLLLVSLSLLFSWCGSDS